MIYKLALSMTSFLPLYSLMIFMYSYVYLYENICPNTKKYILIAVVVITTVQVICILIINRYI